MQEPGSFTSSKTFSKGCEACWSHISSLEQHLVQEEVVTIVFIGVIITVIIGISITAIPGDFH